MIDSAGVEASCPHCRQTFFCENQIWRLLRPDREEYFARWIEEYDFIRFREQRNYHDDPNEYLALPFASNTNPRADEWAVRRRTYRLLMDEVVGEQPLRLLDLGAGNCWLSHRLVRAGHEPCAVDLTTSGFDGLGAARHYQIALGRLFLRCQAEVDALPFYDSLFDMAVFNSSFHYSTDYTVTLTEVLRVLKPDGRLVIIDSPVYHDAESGRRMVEEWQGHFERLYGFRPDSVPSLGYLTYEGMDLLGRQLGIDWEHLVPWYGWRWAVKPYVARLLGRREPAQFGIWIGSRQ